MVDGAYIVKSAPLRADILKMCMKKFDAEILLTNWQGFELSYFPTTEPST